MRRLLALAACAAFAACARTDSSAPASVASGYGPVGYVRMDELVKKHPLYGQLAQYDRNIEALDLTALVPTTLAAGPDVQRAQAQLDAELAAAAKRTNDLLAEKGKEYEARENAAIAAALRAAGGPGSTSVGGVQSQMEGTAQGQLAGAAAQAESDLDAYRKQLDAEDNRQIAAAQDALAARADRTYRAKADELNAKEAALSLQLAKADAPQRLALRTRLSSLALDEAARDDVNKQIDALDRTEADALAAERERDQATLTALQTSLRAGIQRDMQQQVGQIRARSVQRYRARVAQVQSQFAATGGPAISTTLQNGKPVAQVNPNLPAPLRARIAQLHADYTSAFQNDAKQTIADFNKTRADLSRRYELLHGTDTEATQSARTEIVSLEKKRMDLYQQIVAQIDREVKTIAQQRGIAVVVSDVAAPAEGIDLTDDAMKDIETLHD